MTPVGMIREKDVMTVDEGIGIGILWQNVFPGVLGCKDMGRLLPLNMGLSVN